MKSSDIKKLDKEVKAAEGKLPEDKVRSYFEKIYGAPAKEGEEDQDNTRSEEGSRLRKLQDRMKDRI